MSILPSPTFDRALPPENRSVAGKKVECKSPHHDRGDPLFYKAARSASPDLFDLLESRPVWSIEELEKVLTVSRKTLISKPNVGAFRTSELVRAFECTARASLGTFEAR